MFCMKCGNEVNSGEEYCPKCGAKVGAAETTTAVVNQETDDIQKKAIGFLEGIRQNFARLHEEKVYLLGSVILLLISAFLITEPMLEVTDTYGLFSKSLSIFEGHEGISVIAVIAYIAAAVCTVVPFLFPKQRDTSYLILAKVLPVVLSGWLFVFFINMYKMFCALYLGVHFNALAWAFLVVSFVLFFFEYMLSCAINYPRWKS